LSEISSPAGTTDYDIRKFAMPLPFNPPSPVLFQLLGYLDEIASSTVRTSLESQAEGGGNTPVGTTMARIEQGMRVYSSIHARLHRSQKKIFKIMHRLNSMYLDEKVVKSRAGQVLATREDFRGSMDVVPVSDPYIFSETQRMALVDIVRQMSQQNPQLYNMYEVEKRALERLRVPDPESLLIQPDFPSPIDPMSENIAMMAGKKVMAFPSQDHQSYISVTLSLLNDQFFGGNPLSAMPYVPAALEMLKQRTCLWYVETMADMVDKMVPSTKEIVINNLLGLMPEEMRVTLDLPYDPDMSVPTGLMNEIARAMAVTLPAVSQMANEMLAPAMPIIQKSTMLMQQAQQMAAQNAPKDPMAQAAMEDVKRKAAYDQQSLALKKVESENLHQIRTQELQINAQLRQAELQQKQAMEQARLQMAMEKNHNDGAHAAASLEFDMQSKAKEHQLKRELETSQARLDEHIASIEMQHERELAEKQLELELHSIELQGDNQMEIETMKEQNRMEIERMKEQGRREIEEKRMKHERSKADSDAQENGDG
jgi:hypothetical protein